uniref:testis-expressed protein 264 homolog n=1 Tax=Styela clava TaxID=7725 RepID=UPI00193A552D|nr:testis-expressed protein 264 homolog [Styela clava]
MEGLVLIILIVLSLIAIGATIVYLLNYIGYFYRVRVFTGPSIVSEMKVAYKYCVGNYNACGSYFSEAANICPDERLLGIYYDDPKKVDPNQCRYIVGIILAEGSKAKEEVNEEVEGILEERGYKFIIFPNVDFSVKTSHPYAIPMSAYFGATKAYPAMETYIQREKLCARPFLEIYDENTIHYMAPLSKQVEFYTDEVKDLR